MPCRGATACFSRVVHNFPCSCTGVVRPVTWARGPPSADTAPTTTAAAASRTLTRHTLHPATPAARGPPASCPAFAW
jgi:hypothetical protein